FNPAERPWERCRSNSARSGIALHRNNNPPNADTFLSLDRHFYWVEPKTVENKTMLCRYLHGVHISPRLDRVSGLDSHRSCPRAASATRVLLDPVPRNIFPRLIKTLGEKP